MKTTFKALALSAVMMLGFGLQSKAQLGQTIDVDVKAIVLKQITLTKTDVNFGAVIDGNIPILDPKDHTENRFVSARAEVGKVLVDASENQIILVEWPDTIHLASGANRITYRPRLSVGWGNIANDNAGRLTTAYIQDDFTMNPATQATGSGTIDGFGGTGYISTDPVSGDAANDEKASIFIGGNLYDDGSVTAPLAGPTGTYTGTITVNINYTAL